MQILKLKQALKNKGKDAYQQFKVERNLIKMNFRTLIELQINLN